MDDACDHVWIKHPRGGVECPDCGSWLPHSPAPWEPGGKMPAVRGDIRPHFNISAGVPIESRRDLREVCARKGLRPVDPELASPDAAAAECERLRKNNLEKIRNPKRPLSHYYQEQISG
jgi:hypothetical protein